MQCLKVVIQAPPTPYLRSQGLMTNFTKSEKNMLLLYKVPCTTRGYDHLRRVRCLLFSADQLYPLVVQCTIVSKRAEKVALHACA